MANIVTEAITCKLRGGNRLVNTKIWREDDRIFLSFKYNEALKDEIKSMQSPKWHGYDKINPRKVWSIKATPRNEFQLNYLIGNNPYAPYDRDLVNHTSKRSLYSHQDLMVRHALTTHYCIWAADMGLGKTLAAIEVIEAVKPERIFWVAPKSALRSTSLEFRKWNCSIRPEFMTYKRMRSIIENWTQGCKAPQIVIFDESSKIKTPTSKRSQAAMQLAEGVRSDWGEDGYIILMSGTPAPKSPVDWYWQSEVACPGFLKEGTIHKFKERLSLIEMREQMITGGVYPHVVTWLDDENKCAKCGKYKNEHDILTDHNFIKSKNEVELLYHRLKGLVTVLFKEDCLNLPDKIYKIIECKPDQKTLQIAQMLVNTAPRVITGLERMRELSDGFQYDEEEVGIVECPLCHGKGEIEAPHYEKPITTEGNFTDDLVNQTMICDKCGGTGEIAKTNRVVNEVPCPKIEVLKDLLDEYDEQGRVVIYAGFTGSIDRIVEVCMNRQWNVLRADGRGWNGHGIDTDELLKAMDRTHPDRKRLMEEYPRVAFVGQPGAAGMGLNLTNSPVCIYYSNDFNAESRIQSEDRIHRTGMDENKAATIIDIVHLETDLLILNNLRQKRKLQAMSMGDLKSALEHKQPRDIDTIIYGD